MLTLMNLITFALFTRKRWHHLLYSFQWSLAIDYKNYHVIKLVISFIISIILSCVQVYDSKLINCQSFHSTYVDLGR